MGVKCWEFKKQGDWAIVFVTGRIDSFNSQDFERELDSVLAQGQLQLAVDLSGTRFICLPIIKRLTAVASELKARSGHFALLGASERLKRQIDIYATLNPMQVARTFSDLTI
jgi:anti-anti-sigma factor